MIAVLHTGHKRGTGNVLLALNALELLLARLMPSMA